MTDLNPWDEGYQLPNVDAAAIKSENCRKAVAKGTEVKNKNKALIAQGLPPIESANSKMLARRTEDTLSMQKKIFYEAFTLEYLKDFNPQNAWLRAGGKDKNANVKGCQSLRVGYVQKMLASVMESLEVDNLVTAKAIIMGLWREANYFGEDGGAGSRVRALMGLARIKKMDVQVVEQKVQTTHVMVVPMAVNNEAWAQAAADSQAALKADVRN